MATRALVYGLQNSGATLFTYFMAQQPHSLAVPDLYTMFCAPRWAPSQSACIKATATVAFPLEAHHAAFRPDLTILITRRPQDNYLSLKRKPFRHHDGLMADKFALVDSLFADPSAFDAVIRFEDFIADPAGTAAVLAGLGWPLPPDAARMRRGPYEIEMALWQHAPALYETIQWGTGNARLSPLDNVRLTASQDGEAEAFASRHAPRLAAAYAADPPAGMRTAATRTAMGERDFAAPGALAAHLLALFNDAVAGDDLPLAAAILADLAAIAPAEPARWVAALRYDAASGQGTGTADTLRRQLSQSPDPRLEFVLAQHELRAGQPAAAEPHIAAVLAAPGAGLEAWVLAAQISAAARDPAGAEVRARRALDLEPRSLLGNKLLADALARRGEHAAAISHYRLCLAVDPGFRPAERALERLATTPATGA